MWTPSQRLSETAIRIAGAAAQAMRGAGSDLEREAAALDGLQAVGTLASLDLVSDARSAASLLARPVVEAALRGLDMTGLAEGVLTVVLDAPLLATRDGGDRLDLFEEIRDVLAERDRIELVLEGARTLLGTAPALSVEQEAALLEFEQLLRPELWRLVPLGELRAESVAWMHPVRRSAFWWWSAGSDVASTALDELSGAALLIARFPEARSELERLVGAQRAMDATKGVAPCSLGGTAEVEGKVVSLRDWLAARKVQASAKTLRAAASPLAPLVLATPEVELSTEDPSRLLVDVLQAMEPGRVPSLEREGMAPILGRVVPGTLDRFEFDIAGVSARGVQLRIPLLTGERLVSLGDERQG